MSVPPGISESPVVDRAPGRYPGQQQPLEPGQIFPRDVRFSEIVENAIELGLSDSVEFVGVSPTLVPANEVGQREREISETLCPEAIDMPETEKED